MAIDAEVEAAVKEVFAEKNQPEAAARRFVAWLNDMSERELEPNENIEHLEVLRSKLIIRS